MYIGKPLPQGWGILLKTWSATNPIVFKLDVLHITSEGYQISSFTPTITPVISGVDSAVMPVSGLNIIGCVLEYSSGGAPNQPVYCEAYLVDGLSVNANKMFKLFAGQLAKDGTLCYPHIDYNPNNNDFVTFWGAGGTGSAGSNVDWTQNQPLGIELFQGGYTFVCSATVANRYPLVRITGTSGYPLFNYKGSQAMVASTTYYIGIGQGGGDELSQLPYIQVPIPRNLLLQNYHVIIGVDNIQAGDQITGYNLECCLRFNSN